MNYFYCPRSAIGENSFHIEGEEFSHLVHVMRAREGDEIRIVDGEGTAYDARIMSLKQKHAQGVLLRRYEHHHEPHLRLTLGVGMVKNPAKFDFLVEKATEIGVLEVIPLQTERTIRIHANVARWQKLALAAMKQAGRSALPRIRPVMSLEELLSTQEPFDAKFIAHEQRRAGEMLPQKPPKAGSRILYLVGPEGGFSDEEVDRCIRAGCLPQYFGERRLRTETAAIVAAATILLFPPDDSGAGNTAFDGGENFAGRGPAGAEN